MRECTTHDCCWTCFGNFASHLSNECSAVNLVVFLFGAIDVKLAKLQVRSNYLSTWFMFYFPCLSGPYEMFIQPNTAYSYWSSSVVGYLRTQNCCGRFHMGHQFFRPVGSWAREGACNLRILYDDDILSLPYNKNSIGYLYMCCLPCFLRYNCTFFSHSQ